MNFELIIAYRCSVCAFASVVVSRQASLEIYTRSLIRIVMQIFTSIVYF